MDSGDSLRQNGHSITTCSQVGQQVHLKANRPAHAQQMGRWQQLEVTRVEQHVSARQKRSLQMGQSSASSQSESHAKLAMM